MRRLATALVGLGVLLAIGTGQPGSAAAQDAPDPATPAPIDVLEVSGLLDRPLVEEVRSAIERADRDGSQALILQLNSKGAVVDDATVADLAELVHGAPLPVAIWVGPAGARALGTPGQLLGAAVVTGMAPGTRVGELGDPLPVEGFELDLGSEAERLRTRTIGPDEALATGLVRIPNDDQGVPVLRNMVLALDGLEYGGVTVNTAEERVAENGRVEQELVAQPRFFKLGPGARLMHTVASPAVTYLLLTIGLSLLIFEFFTAGVGIAGVVGAISMVLGCYGLDALPVNGWAVAVGLLAFFGLAVDVQTGVPRAWTGIGLVLYVVASFGLFQDGLRPSWITLIVGIGGVALAFVVGMPSMVRARFATPTIGREWMIGELGVARGVVDPEGIVTVRGATWRARTNRATPVAAGGAIRGRRDRRLHARGRAGGRCGA